MTSRYDLLDQYIDGQSIDIDDDPELRELVDTINQITAADAIEWPEFDFPGEMSRNLHRQLDPANATAASNGAQNDDPQPYPLVEHGTSSTEREPEQTGWRWYSRQFAGMAAGALVVALFALGLAYILGAWGGQVRAPGVVVEPGEIPGTILYVEYDGDQTIARIDADGANRQNLATRSSLRAETPGIAWSHDGEWIAYFDPLEREQWSPAGITLVSADGSESEQLDIEPVEGTMRLDASLDWAYQGSNTLAFVHMDPETEQTRIGLFHINTGDFQTLEPQESEPVFNDSHPAWAPDRWALAFSRVDEDGHRGIYLLHGGMSEPVSLVEGDPRATQPEWSPDGASIAYIGATEDDERGNVHVVDVESGQTQNVSSHARWDYLPAWSSRNQIAFMSDFDDMNYDIFLVESDGSDLRNITEDYDWRAYQPDWSDDGRYLTFTSSTEDESQWRLNVYDVDEDQIYTVLERENPLHHAQWQPVQALEDPSDDVDIDVSEISEERLELIRQRAERYMSDEEDPAALVINGEEITAGLIESQEATTRLNQVTMQEMIDEQDEAVPQLIDYNTEFIELIDEYGAINVGLGASLARAATRVFAEEHGLVATEEQIEQAIEHQRESHEVLEEHDPETAAAVGEALIEIIGEERYWEEYLPEVLADSITEQNVDEAVWEATEPESEETFLQERELFLAGFRADLVRDATIEVVDDSLLGDADLDLAIEYITEAYRALQEERLEQVREREQSQESGQSTSLSESAVVPDEEAALDWMNEHISEYDLDLEVVSVDLVTVAQLEEERGPQPRLTDKDALIWRVEVFGQRIPAPGICRGEGEECLEEHVATALWIGAEDGSHNGVSTAPTAEELAQPSDENAEVHPVGNELEAEQRALDIAEELGFPDAEVLDVRAMTAAEMEDEQGPYFPELADLSVTVWRVEFDDVLDDAMRIHCPDGECPNGVSTVFWLDEPSGTRFAYTFHGLE